MISIEYGPTFDAIVFGESEPKKWIAGSDFHVRTVNLGAPVENAKPTDLIHMAIVYDEDGGITVYREGKRYAERYVPKGDRATLRTYPSESHVLLGQRATAERFKLHNRGDRGSAAVRPRADGRRGGRVIPCWGYPLHNRKRREKGSGTGTAVDKPTVPTEGDWIPLFNGKDLTGWSIDAGLGNSWRVDDGNLVVTGPGDGGSRAVSC